MSQSEPNLVYLNYWKRKQLSRNPPEFEVRRHWWDTDDLSDAHGMIYDAISSAGSILDVGAGDMRFMRLAKKRGLAATYHTQDIGNEFEYTYTDLSQVTRTYDVVICMDVLEHLDVSGSVGMIHRLLSLVSPGGILVLQTPNAYFHRHPLSWDMTHLHAYNPIDLWAYLTTLGTDTVVYRVMFGHPPVGLKNRLRERIRTWLALELHLDPCQDLIAIVRKPLEGHQ